MLVSNVNELSLKEEDHLQDVVNYPVHAYPNLVTPMNLFRFNFSLDLGSSVILKIFPLSLFSLFFTLAFSNIELLMFSDNEAR